jgi:hypothetical protein
MDMDSLTAPIRKPDMTHDVFLELLDVLLIVENQQAQVRPTKTSSEFDHVMDQKETILEKMDLISHRLREILRPNAKVYLIGEPKPQTRPKAPPGAGPDA